MMSFLAWTTGLLLIAAVVDHRQPHRLWVPDAYKKEKEKKGIKAPGFYAMMCFFSAVLWFATSGATRNTEATVVETPEQKAEVKDPWNEFPLTPKLKEDIDATDYDERYRDARNKTAKRHISEEEIENYFNGCFIKEREGKCYLDHADFKAAYRYAFRGNYTAQRNVALALSNGEVGIAQNKIQGCAWRIVILASGDHHVDEGDVRTHKVSCGMLSSVEHNAARTRATELVEEIYGTRYIPAEF